MADFFFPLPHSTVWHQTFETLGLLVGTQLYRRRKRASGGLLGKAQYPIVIGVLLGAGLGNKWVFWLEFPHLFRQYWNTAELWWAGQSMVGGLLGGLMGVEIAKKLSNIKHSTGDAMVFPIIVGLVIGRLGCFAAGLSDGTFGIESHMPWAIDFGDGIKRHPTQLYEIAFVLLLGVVIYILQPRLRPDEGMHFRLFLIAYLLWRFVIDFLKPVPYAYPFDLSGIQFVCLIALVIYLPLSLLAHRRNPRV